MYDEDACDLMTYGNFRTSLFAKKKSPFGLKWTPK